MYGPNISCNSHLSLGNLVNVNQLILNLNPQLPRLKYIIEGLFKYILRANEKARFYMLYRVEKERMDKNETKKEGRKEGITYIASWFKEYRLVTII